MERFYNQIAINSTTDTNSSTTGALQIAGGVGIARNLFVGSAVSVVNTSAIGTLLSITGNNDNYCQISIKNSLANSTFSLAVNGTSPFTGAGSSGDFYIYNNTLGYNLLISSTTGVITLPLTTDSTSITTGTLKVAGGIGIAKNLYANYIYTNGIYPTTSGGANLGAVAYRWGWGYINSIDGCSRIQNGSTNFTMDTDAVGQMTINGNLYVGGGYRWIRMTGGNASGALFGAWNQLGDAVHLTYNAYNNNSGWIIDNAGGSTSRISVAYTGIYFYLGGTNSPPTSEKFRIEPYWNYSQGIAPFSDNSYDLGSGGYRWRYIYSNNGTLQTSDEEKKSSIQDLQLGLNFIKDLVPKTYFLKGSIAEEKDHRHFGLTGQNVATTLEKHGVSKFAGLKHSDYGMMLNYSQFIAPLCKAVQELDRMLLEKIAAIEKSIEALSDDIERLKQKSA